MLMQDQGIRVFGINPGRTETDRVAEGMKAKERLSGMTVEEALAAAVKRIPIGRMAKPEEIAQVAVFMSSDPNVRIRSYRTEWARFIDCGRLFGALNGMDSRPAAPVRISSRVPAGNVTPSSR